MKGVAPLIEGVDFDALLADKAFDADWLLAELDTRGAKAIIPPKANRKVTRDYDKHAYKWRHLRVSDLLCMSNLAHASKLKEHDNDDDFQGSFRRAAERR